MTEIPYVPLMSLIDAPEEEQQKYIGYRVADLSELPTKDGTLKGFDGEHVLVQFKAKTKKFTHGDNVVFTVLQPELGVIFETPYSRHAKQEREAKRETHKQEKENNDVQHELKEPQKTNEKPKKRASSSRKKSDAKKDKPDLSSVFVMKRKR